MSSKRCPGKSEYGHGFLRTTVHHGCCLRVLEHELLAEGSRYAAHLDNGDLVVVMPSTAAGRAWHGMYSTPIAVITVVHGDTAEDAARQLAEAMLRGRERLLDALLGIA